MNNAVKKLSPLVFLICFAALISVVFCETGNFAYAAGNSGIVTVTYENGIYKYTDKRNYYGENASLQAVIDKIEADFDVCSFSFDSVVSHAPLSFSGKATAVSGSIYFDFSENEYALTVRSGAQVTFTATVSSKRGGVWVAYNGKFKFLSGLIEIIDCDFSCSAIDVRGEAEIVGGHALYSSENSAFGYGLSVNGGKLILTPDTPITVEGHSAMGISTGSAEINGGNFIATRTSGYSLDVLGGNTVIKNGSFPSPIFDRRLSSSAVLTIDGGNIRNIAITPAFSKYLSVFGAKINADERCNVLIDSTEHEREFTFGYSESGENRGYRITEFDVNGNSFAVNETLTLADNVTVKPKSDNTRTVLFYLNGTVYATKKYVYGASVKLTDLPAPEIKGYAFKNWKEVSDDFTVTDDMTLTAVMELSAPEISFSDTRFTYNGTEHTVSVNLKHELEVECNYLWEKKIGANWQTVSETENITLCKVRDSGEYRLTVNLKYGNDVLFVQKTEMFTVDKGKFRNISHTKFEGVYDPTKWLFDYELNDGFKWADVSVIPTVPVKFYAAVFNSDPDNYEDYELQIEIDLQKAPPVTAPAHKSIRGKFQEKTLEDYASELSANFRWQSPDEKPAVPKKSYEAFYNTDTDNYEDYGCYITVDLIKGDYGEDKKIDTLPTVYRPNYTLSKLNAEIAEKHENYRLNYKQYYLSTNILAAGTVKLNCVYNGDPVNYNDYHFELTVLVSKADYDAEVIENVEKTLRGTYSGKTLSEYPLPPNVYWQNPDVKPTVDVRNYQAYYNADKANYNNYSFVIELLLSKGEYAENDIVIPILNEITYDRNFTLGEITLPQGWQWKDALAVPTVNKSLYEAEFCDDEINYEKYPAEIPLTVNKAKIPLVKFDNKTVTYDGLPHSMYLGELPYPLVCKGYLNNGQVNAGSYEITAELSQTDTDNYKLHPTLIKGILTIEKAPSVIISPDRYDIIVGQTPIITGRADNNEQTLIIPNFTATESGVYTIVLRTEESGNYLSGEKTVIISVNKTEKFIGNAKYPKDYDGSYFYGILINNDTGVPEDADIAFSAFEPEENGAVGLQISVVVDGKPYRGKFTAKIKMTDEMLAASEIKISKNGEAISFTVENGVYLVIETDGNEQFSVCLTAKDVFEWWWIPIGIGIGLLVIGAVVVVLWKKGIIKFKKITKPKDTSESAPTEKNTELKEQNGEKSDLEK